LRRPLNGIFTGCCRWGTRLKLGDLPEVVINLKTAKALGITIARELLLAADAVVE
jgi:ABC-type uncharacterized transport system substrate-binding protein